MKYVKSKLLEEYFNERTKKNESLGMKIERIMNGEIKNVWVNLGT